MGLRPFSGQNYKWWAFLTWGPRAGWTHPGILSALGVSAGLLWAFVWWELRCPTPIMDVRLFKRKVFSMGVTASYLSFVGSSSVRFLMPFYLQAVLGFSPGKVGLIIVPAAAMMIVTGPVSGRLSDRFGWRWFTMGGLVASVVGVLLLSALTPHSSLGLVIAGMVIQSFGLGMFYAPNNSSILSAVEPSKYGVISGFLNLVRNAGNLTRVAVATALVTATMGSMGYLPSLAAVTAEGDPGVLDAFTSGLRSAYLVLAAVLVVGLAASAFKGAPLANGGPSVGEGSPRRRAVGVSQAQTGRD